MASEDGPGGGATSSAAVHLPARLSLRALREAAAGCTGCELHEGATQTVFGEGLVRSRVLLVGEQPGDREDREGRPFVGPAGRVLDRALVEAGIDRTAAYTTNVVKHFRFQPRGKRRIHKTPSAQHISACRPWLDAELVVVDPEVVVPLGATAAKALLGPGFKVTAQRGEVLEWSGRRAVATVHPSSILRGPDDARDAAFADLVDDLRVVAGLLA